jgi:hypothetical protein
MEGGGRGGELCSSAPFRPKDRYKEKKKALVSPNCFKLVFRRFRPRHFFFFTFFPLLCSVDEKKENYCKLGSSNRENYNVP